MSSFRSLTSSQLKNPLIVGTFFLTLAGFITKLIGFFYRIFLSRIFHNEGLGIIGLMSPVMILVHSLCVSGLQNAITRFVAAVNPNRRQDAYCYLFTGILLSCGLSVLMTFLCFRYAEPISLYIIKEPRCADLLRIASLSFPLAALHSCINGFFYGYQKASIPAASMIVEQVTRVASVWLLYHMFLSKQLELPLATACLGMFLGECASAFFSCLLLCANSSQSKFSFTDSLPVLCSWQKGGDLLRLATPLSLNRICISLLSTIEAFQLPSRLMQSGLSSSQALSVYGIFTGMAFPLIMFPSALTGSASALLLPSVAQAQSRGNMQRIRRAVWLTIGSCFFLGIFCMIFFLTCSEFLGTLLFSSKEAAGQIRALSFVCPFLYLSGMLNSILHGLGKTGITFLFSLFSLGLRLSFVLWVVPAIGFSGYLYGILCSQICLDFLLILALRHNIRYNETVSGST